jgi:hypothetical protein
MIKVLYKLIIDIKNHVQQLVFAKICGFIQALCKRYSAKKAYIKTYRVIKRTMVHFLNIFISVKSQCVNYVALFCDRHLLPFLCFCLSFAKAKEKQRERSESLSLMAVGQSRPTLFIKWG